MSPASVVQGARGVNANTLDYWIRRLRPTPPSDSLSPALLPIVVRTRAEVPAPTGSALEFKRPSGLLLCAPLNASPVELAALIRALSAY